MATTYTTEQREKYLEKAAQLAREGLRQSQIAEKIGIHKATLSNWGFRMSEAKRSSEPVQTELKVYPPTEDETTTRRRRSGLVLMAVPMSRVQEVMDVLHQ